MKLLRLYIHNSGVFKNTLIDFTHNNKPQNLICLAGVNGSGKTTVMELIFNLINFLQPNILFTSDIFFDRLKPHILTWTEFAQLDILIENQVLSLVLGDEKNIQYDKQYKDQQSFIIENDIKMIVEQYENHLFKAPTHKNNVMVSQMLTNTFHNRQINRKETKIVKALLKKVTQDINMPLIYLFNAHTREIQDIRYSSVIPQEKQKEDIACKYHPIQEDIKQTLISYDYAYPDKFKELIAWLNKHVLVDKSIKGIDRINFQVIIETRDSSKHVLERLSAGEESLLIIAFKLYLKASHNTIFLIDEVDQSLHPEFQERMIRLIKQLQSEKGCQIMISSHSDIIWNAFKDKGFISLTELVI
ncbi:MAG: AAA family ATPase [Thiomargarita sp.]|nr:AAA family ATPase [Thiomargarita sp.]